MCMSVQDACVPTRLSARSDQDKPKEQAERPALFSCADIPQGLPLSRGAGPQGLRGEPRRSEKPPLPGEVAWRNAEAERLLQICDDLSVTSIKGTSASGRRSLREYACHLLGGGLYSIRLHRSRFLRRCRIRAALLCRRAMMIAVCIRRGIDIGRIAAARARAGRRIRLRIPAAAALLTTVPAEGMCRIGHQRTNDHHRHRAGEAVA